MPRYILTGAPGAGKTAVLRLLESYGWPVVEEAATDVIMVEQAQGHQEPWQAPGFIDKVVCLQRRRQTTAARPEADVVFFDRSPICTLALSRFLGVATTRRLAEEIDRISDGVYAPTVLFIRNQGFIHATPARRISFEESLAFERIHEQTYREHGYQLVDVPAGPLVERAGLIQRTVTRPG